MISGSSPKKHPAFLRNRRDPSQWGEPPTLRGWVFHQPRHLEIIGGVFRHGEPGFRVKHTPHRIQKITSWQFCENVTFIGMAKRPFGKAINLTNPTFGDQVKVTLFESPGGPKKKCPKKKAQRNPWGKTKDFRRIAITSMFTQVSASNQKLVTFFWGAEQAEHL